MNGDDALPPPPQPLVLRDPVGRPARPPGPIVAQLSVLLCIAIVFALLDWWPGQGRTVDAFTNTVVVLVFGVLLVVVALVWAVKSLYVIGRDRRWSWWIAPAPIAVVVALAAVLLVPSPSFESSRSDFDLAVRTVLSSPEPAVFDVRVGPYTMSRIERHDTGAVYFYDSDQAFLTTSGGWVYSPAGPPSGRSGIERGSNRLTSTVRGTSSPRFG
ncbi:DUF1109 domain-containing protein [Rhodococcus ruber]|uniref:DUF1109 domain-containing protein n=1 Tax=Rhodococcus ruber TaxID=1830 RepID=UPI0022B5B3D2|nr:DUF1109 domain-containing protein [Rhodococcus ruber]MCZ4505396.1 DUF1109 domain-containing protein [Rhodococcus ruber]